MLKSLNEANVPVSQDKAKRIAKSLFRELLSDSEIISGGLENLDDVLADMAGGGEFGETNSKEAMQLEAAVKKQIKEYIAKTKIFVKNLLAQ